MQAFSLTKGNLDKLEVISLLQDHLDQMAGTAPPESRHALDLSGLQQPSVHFYTAWSGAQLAGCGAFKQLDATHAEVKSMKTASTFLRQGVAQTLLRHIVAQAKSMGIERLSLETGSMAFFDPARAMYSSFGFTECSPFASYKEDPNSVFMTLMIDK